MVLRCVVFERVARFPRRLGCGYRLTLLELALMWKTAMPRTRLGRLEHKRSVTDDLVARTGRIAGIAQVHGACAQSMPARGLQ
jgi:hypothetical protein